MGIFPDAQGKAVVAGAAGPASAVPLFWPSMLSAVPFFRPPFTFNLLESNHYTSHVLLMKLLSPLETRVIDAKV